MMQTLFILLIHAFFHVYLVCNSLIEISHSAGLNFRLTFNAEDTVHGIKRRYQTECYVLTVVTMGGGKQKQHIYRTVRSTVC